jgi:hypothetical protein
MQGCVEKEGSASFLKKKRTAYFLFTSELCIPHPPSYLAKRSFGRGIEWILIYS